MAKALETDRAETHGFYAVRLHIQLGSVVRVHNNALSLEGREIPTSGGARLTRSGGDPYSVGKKDRLMLVLHTRTMLRVSLLRVMTSCRDSPNFPLTMSRIYKYDKYG